MFNRSLKRTLPGVLLIIISFGDYFIFGTGGGAEPSLSSKHCPIGECSEEMLTWFIWNLREREREMSFGFI